jgi:hypothetical protein
MKYRWFVPGLLLLAAVMACGPSQNNILQTQASGVTLTARAQQTLTAATPSPTRRPLIRSTTVPTDTPPPADTAAIQTDASATPTLHLLKLPTRAPSPTPTPTPTPTRTRTPTRRPVPAGPTFLETVVAVRQQVENFGGQIDIAVNSGQLDCQQTVNSYEYVAARASLNNVPTSLAGAYGLYTQGVSIFLTKSADLYQNCKTFLANPSGGSVPALQWTVARTAVNDADQLLRQAVIAAGGTP